jgi:hypothetical protein
MPRHPEAFELDEQDFLKEWPTFDSLQFGEVDPPKWALRAIQKRGGRRHPKRQVQYSHMGSYLPMPVVPFQPARPSAGSHLVAIGPRNSTDSDAKAIFDKCMAKERRKAQERRSREQVSWRKQVPQGNLIEDDYRYWKGFAISTANADEGTCRWCQLLFKSRPRMLEHHNKGNCKQHLAALYRYAKLSSKAQHYCLACKRETTGARWGIPLCDSAECISSWKFKFNVQLPGFQQYREWALKAQLQAGSKGPFGDIPPSDDLEDMELFPVPC